MHNLLQLCGFHLDAGGVTLLCCSYGLRDEVEFLLDITLIALIASGFRGSHQCLVGDAPFVAAEAEGALLAVGKDAVEGALHVVSLQLAVRHFVVGLQQVEWRVGIVDLLGL